jgi:hypothetical protein
MNCTILHCDKPVLARKLCQSHYAQVQRHGEINSGPRDPYTTSRHTCVVPGCRRRNKNVGFCPTHYRKVLYPNYYDEKAIKA